MHYLFLPKNHLAPIRRWAARHGATLAIAGDTFVLTVTLQDRVINFTPRFSIMTESGLAYTHHFGETGGFIGWLPYTFKRWPMSSDKLLFKQFFADHGMRVPPLVPLDEPSRSDFLVKSRSGSFGVQVRGPFNAMAHDVRSHPLQPSEFAEQFIVGRAAKAWFWDEAPVALELIDTPYLLGDGRRSVEQILAEPRGSMDRQYAVDDALPMLTWQQLTPQSVPPRGQKIWLGFKYVTPYDRLTLLDREAWASCSDGLRAQVTQAGRVAHQGIPVETRRRSLFSLDAVVDADGRAWWLEMNSNPMVHPRTYTAMLADLFETD